MCLYVSNDAAVTGPTVAAEDVVCYKVMWHSRVVSLRERLFGKKLYSPFKLYEYKLNKRVHSKLMLETYRRSSLLIDVGLHSLKTLESAQFTRDYMAQEFRGSLRRVNRKYVVVKCVIPAGRKYYEGLWYDTSDDCDEHESYASDALIVKEIV